jgi:hypothetical protein
MATEPVLPQDPFGQAAQQQAFVQTEVLNQIADIQTLLTGGVAGEGGSGGLLGQLQATIAGLVSWAPGSDWRDELPEIEEFSPDLTFEPPEAIIDDTTRPNLGDITVPNIEDAPPTDSINEIVPPTIPDFNSGVSIVIPPVPGQNVIQPPGVPPEAPILTYPDDVAVTLPPVPGLTDIVIPDFAGLSLPTFDPEYPTFTEQNINTVISWEEPTYNEQVIDEVKTQITTFLNGGSGIDPVVENAIVARGRDREDRLTKQEEQQATEEWANRGYTAPPGLLVQRLENVRDKNTIKKLGLQREMTIKVHQDEIDNLRFAVQQGIEAEKLYVQMHLAAVERLFEIQRLAIQWLIDLYNISVAVFNARMQEVAIRAQAYESQIRGELARVEVYRAEIDAELAKAEVNKSLVEVYKAQIEAQELIVSIFVAELEGVKARAEVYATEIDGYKGKVDAYAAEVDADKTRFEAYAARIQGEVGKASIIEAEARAYQAEIQGISVGVQAEVETIRGQVAKIQTEIQGYDANIRGQVGRAQIELGKVDINSKAYVADVARYAAEVGREEASARVETAAWDAGNRIGVAFFEAQVAKYGTDLQAFLTEFNMMLEAIQTAGQLESTIAAGALAALNVGAQVQASAGVASSGRLGESFTWQQSKSCETVNQRTASFQATSDPQLSCGF